VLYIGERRRDARKKREEGTRKKEEVGDGQLSL
jgi:hypothetical protein